MELYIKPRNVKTFMETKCFPWACITLSIYHDCVHKASMHGWTCKVQKSWYPGTPCELLKCNSDRICSYLSCIFAENKTKQTSQLLLLCGGSWEIQHLHCNSHKCTAPFLMHSIHKIAFYTIELKSAQTLAQCASSFNHRIYCMLQQLTKF